MFVSSQFDSSMLWFHVKNVLVESEIFTISENAVNRVVTFRVLERIDFCKDSFCILFSENPPFCSKNGILITENQLIQMSLLMVMKVPFIIFDHNY
jgi:hypothetical protein